MTKITVKMARGLLSGSYELSMEGHANYNPGNDIVCAALSSQFFALANYLDGIGADPFVKYDQATGFGYIKCRGNMRVRFAFEYCLYAFMMLAQKYSDNVSVFEE